MSSQARGDIDPGTRRAIEVFRDRLASRYRVRGTVLFGSRARRDSRNDSDADVAVLLAGRSGSRVDVAMELADVAFDIMLETGILIEPIPFWEDEWDYPEHFANPALIANIRQDGIFL